jgi:hypothetical protein
VVSFGSGSFFRFYGLRVEFGCFGMIYLESCDPPSSLKQAKIQPPLPEGFILDTLADRVRERRIQTFQFILLPPFGLLMLGCATFWVARGFRS